MQSLVRHLHAFIDDVALTEAEWQAAIDFLTRTGQLCDDQRQEFVLLSDVLGASMATVAVNAPADPQATEATVLGPFFVEGSPRFELGDDLSGGAPGQPCYVSGTVRDTDGTAGAGRPAGDLGVRRERLLRRAVADGDAVAHAVTCSPTTTALLVLVGEAGAVPDPARRAGRRAADRRRPRPDAAGPHPLQGQRARHAQR